MRTPPSLTSRCDEPRRLAAFVAGRVAWRPDGMTVGVGDSAVLGIEPPRAFGSLIGISAGFTPDLLVEVETMAVLGSCPC